MRIPLLFALTFLLAGCASIGNTKSDDGALHAQADNAAAKSLDEVNRPRKSKSLELLQLVKGGTLPKGTIEGRSAFIAFYSFDPDFPGGHFMVYVFRDNREVRIVPGE